MRFKTIGVIILSSIITYFILGYWFVQKSWLENDFYTQSVAIISGCATIVGIFSIFTSFKTKIENIKPTILKDITKNIEILNKQKLEINDVDNQLTEKQKKIVQLELKQKELEIFIKKTSLVIFLNDQLEKNSIRLKELIENNTELKHCMHDREQIENKLKQLDEEIKQDENYEFFNELLSKNDLWDNSTPAKFSNSIISKMYNIFDDEYI